MNSIKIIGCLVTFILLVAVIAPVSANSYFGISQVGTKFYGSQISTSSGLNMFTAGTNNYPYLKYNLVVKGSGTSPALGQISSYSNYHSQSPSQILDSSESTSVSGTIYSFSKFISFSS
jgi:hypothetical protein